MTTITIHASFLPFEDADESLAFYRDVLGFEVRNDVGYAGMRWITVGPPNQPDTSIVLQPAVEIARLAGATVIQHERNSGKGAALSTGLRAARAYDPAVVVLLDADYQHRPREMGLVTAPVLAGEADIVVGSRYLNDASDVPTHRVLGHRVFNLMTNWSSGNQ